MFVLGFYNLSCRYPKAAATPVPEQMQNIFVIF